MSMIAIIDYNAGNLRSVERALLHLGLDCRITAREEEIFAAERVIFPGVGAVGQAMETIRARGLDVILHEVVRRGTPFLGICLGCQIILDTSEEDDSPRCLGLVPGVARRFPVSPLKVPHMGWNTVSDCRMHPVLSGIDPRSQFYFVHSFYPAPAVEDDVCARTEYGISFASVIGRGNVVAAQFHPEKSGRPGLQLLKNFSCWDGSLS